MVHTLKHIALRVWGTVLIGGLACLWLLPILGSGLNLTWVFVPVLLLSLFTFFFLGWILNHLALFLADRHIQEAATWERLGSSKEAGKAYEKALALFDSFLISPRKKQLESGRLMSRLTRFYLARADKRHYSEAFIVSYLNSHPDDHEVAESWLRQVRSGEGLAPEHHDTAARVGEALKNNRSVQQLLARLYLSENRMDFPALQTYRLATRGRGQAARAMADDLARLFLKDGRADEWALQLYLQATSENSRRQEFLNGIAACVHWIPETGRNRRLIKLGRRLLEGIDPGRLEMMRVGFTPPKPPEPPVKRSRFPGGMVRAICKAFTIVGEIFTNLSLSALSLITDVFHQIRLSSLTRPFLKWTAAALLATGVVVLIVNTASHLVQSPAPQDDPATPVEKIVADRFSLQVAAYLKKKHAEKYAAELKALGIDAYWVETTRRNKLWYLVRVSHFPDKAAARAYGVALRKKGLIDDFYVANYDPG